MIVVGGLSGAAQSLFFLFHYGGFCGVHGIFVQSLLLDGDTAMSAQQTWPFPFIFVELLVDVCTQILAMAPTTWIVAFIGLLVSHGYSFVTNFLLGGEAQQKTTAELMSAPYKRIVVMHAAIIAGGFGILALGEPTILLIVLIGLKTALDIALHRRSHRGSTAS